MTKGKKQEPASEVEETEVMITVGANVVLKGGVQRMTVESVIPFTNQVVCVWVNKSGDFNRESIFASSLNLVVS